MEICLPGLIQVHAAACECHFDIFFNRGFGFFCSYLCLLLHFSTLIILHPSYIEGLHFLACFLNSSMDSCTYSQPCILFARHLLSSLSFPLSEYVPQQSLVCLYPSH